MADYYLDDTQQPRRSRRIPGPEGGFLRGVRDTFSGAARGGASYAGRGMLEAELVVAIVIIAIRIVADYTPSPNGPSYKGTVVPPNKQLGPLSIFAAVITVFFILSFAAKRGGTTAKLVVILGGIIVLSLAMKSWTQISEVAGALTRTTGTTAITTDAASGASFITTADITQEEFGSSTSAPSNIQVTGLTTPENTTDTNPLTAGNTEGLSTGSTDLSGQTPTTVSAGDASGLFPTILPGSSGIQGNVPGVSAPGAPGFPGLTGSSQNSQPTPEPAPGG